MISDFGPEWQPLCNPCQTNTCRGV